MKARLLLTTSAMALAAGSAEAVEWEVVVGGYFESYAAYSSPDVAGLDGDFDGVDQKSEAEIHFIPSITLDNGLQIGADVQLEASGDPDTIDESFLFVDGEFGRVLLGSADSAGYLMHYGAPDVTFLNVNSGSMTIFVPFSGTVSGTLENTGTVGDLQVGDDVFYGTLGSTYLENRGTNDAQRLTYFTPRFAGLQLGVSYARDGLEDNQAQLNLEDEPLRDIVDVGAN
jgi:Gram-negative porin